VGSTQSKSFAWGGQAIEKGEANSGGQIETVINPREAASYQALQSPKRKDFQPKQTAIPKDPH